MVGLAVASMLTISQLVWGWPGTGGGLLTGRVWGGALVAMSVIALRRAASVPVGMVAPQEIAAPAVARFPAVLDRSCQKNVSASLSEARMVPRGEEKSRRVSGWIGAIVVVLALVSALLTFLVLSGATPIAPVHEVVVGVFVLNALLILVLI